MMYDEITCISVYTCAMISFQQRISLGMEMTGGQNTVKEMDHSVSVATCILSRRMTVRDRDLLASE